MFGSDGSPIVQYVVIFAVIFTALAGIVFVVRRLTGQALPSSGRAAARGRQPRLGIVDVYELDRARQLILLRRDNVEHLLLVGGPNDVVVERNIQRGQRPLPEAALRPEPVAGALAEPLPDPLAGAGRLPEPQRALPDGAARRTEPLLDPGFKMPVVVRPPVPGSGSAPPVTLPLEAGLVDGDEPARDEAAALTATPRTDPAAVPAAAPSGRERFSARRILGRTNPPPLAPEPAPERPPERSAEAGPVLPTPPLPRERRSVDPAILSDMARQLQAALARPASAVTPAPLAQPEPASVDPMAAAMASAPPPPAAPGAEAPAPAPPPAPALAPALPRATPFPSARSPVPPPPAPSRPVPPVAGPAVERPAPESGPSPEGNAAGNPFSVEEIEAEFARLLGRPLDKRG